MAYLWKSSRTTTTDRLARMISPDDMLLDQPVFPSPKASSLEVERKPAKARKYRAVEQAFDQLEDLATGRIRAEVLAKLWVLERR